MEQGGGTLAALVAVGLTAVVVEGEAGVGTGIDAAFLGRVGLLAGVFGDGAQRQHRAGMHEQRELLQPLLALDAAAAGMALLCPVVRAAPG